MADNGQMSYANTFTTDHKTLIINIVDADIKNEYSYEVTEVTLLIRNDICVTSTKTNFITPLIIREDGFR